MSLAIVGASLRMLWVSFAKKREADELPHKLRVMIGNQNVYHGPQQDGSHISLESIARVVSLDDNAFGCGNPSGQLYAFAPGHVQE
jgi:hypothetical protein